MTTKDSFGSRREVREYQKLEPRTHADEVLAEIEREEERQRTALKAFYQRERAPVKVPLSPRRAWAIFLGVFILGSALVLSIARWWPL